ncbi:FAD-dependent oxidoreductase [Paracoccus lutimaris]|uniref:FAD-dependent oxidoreductase n=1 Tax=Paracoccus lutimaris TaxID=1490030 RepID=UPI001C6A31DE|nr:FAD-dependent oxidoreductase [Paracoccus lutimaris]
MKSPVFTDGDATADIAIVGSGVVGALIAEQLAGEGHAVLMLDAGLRLNRGQVVENWRNMPFANRLGSARIIRGCFRNRQWRRRRFTCPGTITSPCPGRTETAFSRAI